MAESSGKCEEAQTSADMLRNTPSNIRRLADEIQQCEGRQKYLAHTRSPSDGGDVRWYFCKVPMAEKELAAAVPRTEIVGKSDYFRFGMRDSLAIEASFLQREEELLSSWWKEYAECSVGPKGLPASNSKSDPRLKSYSLESTNSGKLYADEEERVGVPVKGGLYEVDLVRRHCFPVYWNGENRRVVRGHWFARKGGLDWLPLREDVAEQLEFAYRSRVWHRRTFQPSGLFAARVDMQGSSPGLHALFTGEDDTWDAWLNTDASGLSSMVKFGGSGIKLRRGYAPSHSPKPTQDEMRQRKEEEIDDYCSQECKLGGEDFSVPVSIKDVMTMQELEQEVPVRHLVFMVHGIGQRLEKANLVDDVGTFRHITASLAEQHLTSYQRGTQRVLFIPCQWRKDLKLSGESAVEKCTLPGVRGLRVTLSATVHDVLYYMSPIYCQDIIDSVSNQLNRLYLKFLKRNPGYDGKVSLYGHSLGSVLSYDILCHQEILSSPFPMDWMYKDPIKYESSSRSAVNSSSQCNSSSPLVLGDTNNGGMDAADPAGKGILCAESESSLPETHAEESSSLFTPPLVLASDDNSLVAMESNQQDSANLLQEAGVKSDHDLSEMQSQQNSSLDECTGISGFVLTNDSNQIDEEIRQSNSDKTIKSLREEIDVLKARIRELESNRAEGNRQEVATMRNESILVSSQSGRFETPKSYTPYIKYTKLEFKVDTFFAVGSPLGVFLALRNVRMGIGKGKDYWVDENINEEMPSCRQMFNIFHPFDPVAYRVEPLVCKECLDKRPVIIPYHRGGKRLHIGFQDFVEDVASCSQVVIDHMNSVKTKVLRLCQSRKDDDLEEASDKPEEEVERSYGSIMLERLTGSEDGRIDHVLQDKTFQHQYISAVGAHTNYWRDPDTALFILRHLYHDIPDDAETPLTSGENSTTQAIADWQGWYDKEETTEEELPLTFADRKFVKKFSRRAKKFMNH